MIAALALVAIAAPDHQRIDIPAAYVGRWALDPQYCTDPGPAVVTIAPRQIAFFERTGYLQLAQLNEATDPPAFFGRFSFVQQLRFSDQVERLELVGGKLRITEGADPDAPANRMAWTRCPIM